MRATSKPENKKNPWGAVAIAALIGLLIGKIT